MAVKQCMGILDKRIKVIVPVRTLQEKRMGRWELREKPLIPGYVFVYAEDKVSFEAIKSPLNVYRILQYQMGQRELTGSDFEYAVWIYRHDGKITPSKVLFEGSDVRVVDGPLMDTMGRITRIDRHKRRAWVEFDFDGRKQVVSLSVIDLTSCEH
jgi:transcriptional antiterminator NusG